MTIVEAGEASDWEFAPPIRMTPAHASRALVRIKFDHLIMPCVTGGFSGISQERLKFEFELATALINDDLGERGCSLKLGTLM